MSLVKVVYDHREGGEEFITHEKEVRLHRELCEIIDAYPWAEEMEAFDKYGVGGGLYFALGDDSVYACYQFVPVDINAGILSLDVVLKPGFLNMFGRKSASQYFNIVSIPEAKSKLKDLFDHTIESLYEKHKH